jgi:hypothetical protein
MIALAALGSESHAAGCTEPHRVFVRPSGSRFQALVRERDCAGIALTTLQALPPPGLTQFANSANKRDPPPK